MLWALVIDRAAMFDPKRTWLSRANLVAPNYNLQPAIAACGAGATAPSVVGLFHWAILFTRRISARMAAYQFSKTRAGPPKPLVESRRRHYFRFHLLAG
jgi:hypothetical protein